MRRQTQVTAAHWPVSDYNVFGFFPLTHDGDDAQILKQN